MALSEFKLIERFFSDPQVSRGDVVLGVGDDAAVVSVPEGHELVVAVDTIVAGVHFPLDLDPRAIGYRALAVNLSDMAAMGARPAWFTLTLTLPEADERWLEGFSGGLLGLAKTHQVALIGGDTTHGPLTIGVQILGLVPAGAAIRRCGARIGDIVCLSGHVGDAGAGLQLLIDRQSGPDQAYLIERFRYPTPRVGLGCALRGLASAAIDVSDGLYADLEKLTAASGVGAQLQLDALPISHQLLRSHGADRAREYALTGGDDYEICFTVPSERLAALENTIRSKGEIIHRIGVIEAAGGLRCYADGRALDLEFSGYDHFTR